jgi:glycosyltransferase involved in cell wall biosynthesis
MDSILMQSFTNYEIIISDDSTSDDVSILIDSYIITYPDKLIRYYRNSPSLGSPTNWNFAISQAKGKFIKIMHHDDWFPNNSILEKYVEKLNTNCKTIVFGGSNTLIVRQSKERINLPTIEQFTIIKKKPINLIFGNLIGSPSSIIFPNIQVEFDSNLKWLVDIDFYLKLLIEYDFELNYIHEVTIDNVLDDHNITNECLYDFEINLKEYSYIFSKYRNSFNFKEKIIVLNFIYKYLISIKNKGKFITVLRLLKRVL